MNDTKILEILKENDYKVKMIGKHEWVANKGSIKVKIND